MLSQNAADIYGLHCPCAAPTPQASARSLCKLSHCIDDLFLLSRFAFALSSFSSLNLGLQLEFWGRCLRGLSQRGG